MTNQINNKDCSQCSRRSWYQIGYADGFTKATDDFKQLLKMETYNDYESVEDYFEDTIKTETVEDIKKIARKLKAAGNNTINR